MKPYVITIARQYGSGGKTVGKMLADKLGIPFYNREIITMASEDSGVNAMLFSDERLKGDFLTRLRAHYHGNAPVPNDSSKSYLKDEALFAYQVKIIRRLADQGPCVMIGRRGFFAAGTDGGGRCCSNPSATIPLMCFYKTETPAPGSDTGVLGGRGWIRTTEAEKQQIYSLSPLATREHAHILLSARPSRTTQLF